MTIVMLSLKDGVPYKKTAAVISLLPQYFQLSVHVKGNVNAY